MSCYLCHLCQNLIDNDYHPCEEYQGQLICDDCAAQLQDKDND